jgi:hypothetical protein
MGMNEPSKVGTVERILSLASSGVALVGAILRLIRDLS